MSRSQKIQSRRLKSTMEVDDEQSKKIQDGMMATKTPGFLGGKSMKVAGNGGNGGKALSAEQKEKQMWSSKLRTVKSKLLKTQTDVTNKLKDMKRDKSFQNKPLAKQIMNQLTKGCAHLKSQNDMLVAIEIKGKVDKSLEPKLSKAQEDVDSLLTV